MKTLTYVAAASLLFVMGIPQATGQERGQAAPAASAAGYNSIQEAIDANPGRIVYVPPGDYEITEKIRLRTDNSGLCGPGRIIQKNTAVPIVEIEDAAGVQLRDLILTRPEGRMDTETEAVLVIRCRDVVLDKFQILDNRTRSAAIALRDCRHCQIRFCLVRNYMRITIDDRTANGDWGYAFRCIDGTGISVRSSVGTSIQSCRVVEHHLLPTPEVKEKFHLGEFVKKNAARGRLVSQDTWDGEYVDNWHQGSAIIVTSPTTSDFTQILGNYIENAAQGIDLHADHVIVSHNVVNNAFVGMKAMHGSRNILVTGNQFCKNDLWSIGMMPGAASYSARPVSPGAKTIISNVDGGSIIANNIISDFGHGNAHWVWGDTGTPLRFDAGQKPENPPLSDVIVQGNIVYCAGSATTGSDAPEEPPRYKYAVRVETSVRGLRFSNNIFHAGTEGVSNVPLHP